MAEAGPRDEGQGALPAPAAATPLPGVPRPTPSGGLPPSAADGVARVRGEDAVGRSNNLSFPQRILNIGFLSALVLAGASLLVGAIYLFVFLWKTSTSVEVLLARGRVEHIASADLKLAISAQLIVAKIALLSCSILVGMAFGFLGFSLFLIGIRAEMDIEADREGTQVKLARLSPGVFVILCAAVMISVAATHPTPFSMESVPAPGSAATAPASGRGRPARETGPGASSTPIRTEDLVGSEYLGSLGGGSAPDPVERPHVPAATRPPTDRDRRAPAASTAP